MVHTPRTLPPPPQLVKYSKKWTVRFQAVLNANPPRDWATAHAKKVLRAALRELARGKCVFCESALEVTTYMEIEHYVAKTVNSDLAFEWTNLLPACRLCNNAKGEQDHKGALLKLRTRLRPGFGDDQGLSARLLFRAPRGRGRLRRLGR